MDLSNRVLGAHAADYIRNTQQSTVLNIGKDTFTRKQLAGVDCFNFTAAANLSHLLNEHLKVANVKDVYQRVHPSALALPRLGAVALAVLGAAFEAVGVGGDAPLENWITKHLGKDEHLTTFGGIKARFERKDKLARKLERATLRNRTAGRKNKAHGLRLARFEGRNGKHRLSA